MAQKVLLIGDDAKSPAFSSRVKLLEVLREQFPEAEWKIWEELEQEQANNNAPLAPIRSLEVTQSGYVTPEGLGRAITVIGEIRILATPSTGGLMTQSEGAPFQILSDALDKWLFKAAHSADWQGVTSGIKADLEQIGLYDVNIGTRREATRPVDFTHLNRHPFGVTVYVGPEDG